jgi:hypothetical protein
MDMKTCFKCRERKLRSDFYRHPQMADGHLNACKQCLCAEAAKRRIDFADLARERDRKRAGRPERVAAREAYRKTQIGKLNKLEAQRRSRARNPEKHAARAAVAYALRTGSLIRGACEVCGDLKTEGHHDNYGEPLSVRWLCRVHHHIHHATTAQTP